jgi:hypothetical protein
LGKFSRQQNVFNIQKKIIRAMAEAKKSPVTNYLKNLIYFPTPVNSYSLTAIHGGQYGNASNTERSPHFLHLSPCARI